MEAWEAALLAFWLGGGLVMFVTVLVDQRRTQPATVFDLIVLVFFGVPILLLISLPRWLLLKRSGYL